jgi:hypothetical protein
VFGVNTAAKADIAATEFVKRGGIGGARDASYQNPILSIHLRSSGTGKPSP